MKITSFKHIVVVLLSQWFNICLISVKKDTLKLHKYEETLLLYYKKYLQKLEKYGFSIIRKKGQSKFLSEVSNMTDQRSNFDNFVFFF